MTGKVDFDIIVIGGGIVGLASAYKIALRRPATRIAVLEKEERLATHQTGRNSGVIHSGLYYKPGSTKARTCAAGRKQLVEFAREHSIPHEITGKIIVAVDEKELPVLECLLEIGRANEIDGLERIGPDRIKEIEPACAGLAAIVVPSTGIIDYVRVAEKLAELIRTESDGNRILTSHEVMGFEKHDFYTRVRTSQGDLAAKYVINCAGLQSDRIAKMDGIEPGLRIVPFRGDYFELAGHAAGKVRSLIYPVPDPALPFLGVHLTRMIDGSVECGPNAVFSFKREGYRKTDFSITDTWQALSYFGTWRLFLKHMAYGAAEYARAFSKTLFLRRLQRLIPSLQPEDILPARSGVRAQALGPRGDLIDDFVIETNANSIHVLNAPSPAATASLAIADRIAEIAAKQFRLETPKKTPGKTVKREPKTKATKEKAAKPETAKAKTRKKAKKRKAAEKPKRRGRSPKSRD